MKEHSKKKHSILGVPLPTAVCALEESKHVARILENFGCIVVETSAIQSDESLESVCAECFTANQLVGVSFCYRFQIIISAQTFGSAQLFTETLEENRSANDIGPMNNMKIVQQSAPTTSPSSKPNVSPSNVPYVQLSSTGSSASASSTSNTNIKLLA